MKLAALLVAIAACASPNSPQQPVSPLPPDRPIPEDAATETEATPPVQAKTDPSKIVWPVFPTIGAVPTSHPTGDPITIPSPVVKVGDKHNRLIAGTFEQHYVHDKDTRYQLTKRDFDLDVAVLAVDNNHPSRLEVDANKANEWIALADVPTTTPRQSTPLLQGTYTVTADSGRDGVKVTRGPGMDVYSRETEELGGLFGDELGAPDTTLVFLRAKRLRLGEVVALTDADKKTLGGGDLSGTFSIALITADPKTVIYQMDIDATGGLGTLSEKASIRMRATIKFERATGFLMAMTRVTHKLDKAGDAVDDTFSSESMTYTRR
jgi:hypothetical protein